MSQEELSQFVDAVVEASAFSPRVDSKKTMEWRDTIRRNGGLDLLRAAIAQAEDR